MRDNASQAQLSALGDLNIHEMVNSFHQLRLTT